jgi:phage baseplate assembly protein W
MATKRLLENEEYKQNSQITTVYSDFNHFFKANPFTGDIGRKINVESVKQSIRNIVLTNKYERLRNPDFGSNLRRFLFENYNEYRTGEEIGREIVRTIERYEPRAEVINVNVTNDEDRNSIDVQIKYSIRMVDSEETLNLKLYRVR